MALQFGTPIIPVSVVGAFEFNKKTGWLIRPGTVTVHLHDVIETKDLRKEDFPALRDKVHAVEDRLNAVVADNPTAAALRVKVGAPLLKIDRIAYASNRRPVEWRVWLCHLRNGHYLARMGG